MKSLIRKVSSKSLIAGLKDELISHLSMYAYYQFIFDKRTDLVNAYSRQQQQFNWAQIVTMFGILHEGNKTHHRAKYDYHNIASHEDYMKYRNHVLNAASKTLAGDPLTIDESQAWTELQQWSGISEDQFNYRFSPKNWQSLNGSKVA